MQKFLTQIGGDQAKAGLQVLNNLTGVDLMKDLDRVYVWGRVKDDNSVVAVFQGRFNHDKPITLLKANPKYAEGNYKGVTTHEWFDDKEKRVKFGAFLTDGSAVIANQRESLQATIDANGSDKGFHSTPKAQLLPSGYKDSTAWGLLIRPDRAFPNGEFKDTLQAGSATAMITLRDGKVALRLSVNTDSAEAAAQWQKLAQGGLAFLQLQKENAEARELAASAKVSLDSKANRVSLDVEIAEEKVIELIRKKKGQ